MQNNLADSQQHFEGVSVAVAKVFPPIAVSGFNACRHDQDWLIMATLLYTVIQIIIALPKLKQSFNEWRNKMKYLPAYTIISFVFSVFCFLYFFY